MEENKLGECEAKQLTERWSQLGLLNGIEDKYQKQCVAVILENQRLVNENICEEGCAQFKRLSIPLVRRIYASNFIMHELINVQPSLGREINVFYKHGNAITSRRNEVFVKPMTCHIKRDMIPEIRAQHNLNKEAEQVATIAIDFCDEISKDIISDLRSVATTSIGTNLANLSSSIEAARSSMESKIGNRPNWIIANTKMIEELKKIHQFEEHEPSPYQNIRKVGILDGMKVIKDDSLYDDEINDTTILLGYRGTEFFDAGYVYSPYVALMQTPTMVDPVTFESNRKLFTIHAKTSTNGDYYIRVSVR